MREIGPAGRVAVAALAALATLAGGASAAAAQMLLALAAGFAIVSVFAAALRVRLLQATAALLGGCAAALAWHLVSDHFSVRYVWLYSAAELPLHLKLANVWGGDEGTTLMLAVLCAVLALGVAKRDAPGSRVGALIAAWYAATAVWLAPFSATPAGWLADAPSQGMNAHLMKVWMLLHAPLVLAAYAWALFVAVPAFAALRGALPVWPNDARAHARRAWVVLSAGIGFGMLWAFEDAMYGQVWHWDPVQTAVFAVWCFLSAHLHGVGSWRPGQATWRWAPLTGVLAAAATAGAMAVTRSPLLASSHRYVGADSWISHVALAVLLLGVSGFLLVRGRVAADGLRRALSPGWGLRFAQWGFAAAGVFALASLAQAFASAGLGLPRAEEDKPFLAMLSNLVHGAQLDALKAAFEQWDVGGYALARALLLPLALFGFVGGWYFFRRVSSRASWLSLAAAALVTAAILASGGVMTREYAGNGILSQRIVALLPLLDASLAAGAYLALGCTAWALRSVARTGPHGAVGAVVPIAAVHVGAMLMLWGGLLSTALNSYSEYQVPLDGTGAWQHDRHGALRLAVADTGAVADGGFASKSAVRAVTSFEFRDSSGELFHGETLYRDVRPPPERYDGPLRAACELLDYRYARHVGTAGYVVQPAIDHGWSRALQVWVSPSSAFAGLPGAAQPSPPPVATVVVKVFPYSSLLWAGLVLTVAGGAWLAFAPRARRRESKDERS